MPDATQARAKKSLKGLALEAWASGGARDGCRSVAISMQLVMLDTDTAACLSKEQVRAAGGGSPPGFCPSPLQI